MGTFVRIVQGVWEKTPTGEWRFDENPAAEQDTLLIHPHDSFEGLVEMIRIRLDLGVLTPVALTYQLPEWMLLPEGPKTPPVTLSTDRDIEVMLSEGVYDTTDLVGGQPIVCRQSMLELLFNEPQLLIVYRVALEIDMVYAPTPEERAAFQRLTVDDMIAIQDGETTLTREGTMHQQKKEEVTEEQFDANGISETQQNYEVNVTPAPRPTNGALGLPIGPNLRVNAPTTPTSVLVVHDDEASYTGSSDGLNNGNNNRGLAPLIPMRESVINISQALEQGCSKAKPGGLVDHAKWSDTGLSKKKCLDLTLGIGMNNNTATEAIIEIEDSDSEADGDSGGFGPDPFF
ncbi:hypothetical protein Bca101_031928 [Brassica carinata]